MRFFLIGAAALLVAATSPALADTHHPGEGKKPAKEVHVGGHPGGGGPKPSRHVHVEGHVARPATHVHATVRGGKWHRAWHRAHRPSRHTHIVVRRAPPAAAPVDVSRLHRVIHALRRYHAGTYNRPYKWYSYDWRVGQKLPQDWYAHEYWIEDWRSFGLFAPPAGLIWVRVGPDAVLIDENSGEIVTV